MAEVHVMKVRWSGREAIANALRQAAEAHDCLVVTEQQGDHVVLSISVSDDDLQTLRDRVDALLIAFGDVEEALDG
jgi:ABC-type proline/glycine betaine transport system substrate-binding protein